MADVNAVIEQMKNKFNSDAAAGMNEVFQFDIEDGDHYYIQVSDGTCTIEQGEHDDPSVTLIMSSQTLKDVMSGETDGMQAFMAGKLRAEGDMMLATKLSALFPV
ncbi:SCP-2 family sterol carrier protein [Terasakiispira papahanaumokuakeensis]|uniref:SCP-2 family sterol carrier protein n=1 Tax=Terasakiispira papahanaumokuakeensis TaxID=197479 RepID=A0A1E2V9K8_9GAMM|nr:SCP2 sterol-binding domain-containing protein [Terasakiispira papahanaumokuakeensis]ODC03335.1 SCP-2 family sterol carrier protein [Terasakiispira papahanaumokuakeensis]